jgi:hypothetical protein
MLKRKLGTIRKLLFARTESVQLVRSFKGRSDCPSGQAFYYVTKFGLIDSALLDLLAQISAFNLQSAGLASTRFELTFSAVAMVTFCVSVLT